MRKLRISLKSLSIRRRLFLILVFQAFTVCLLCWIALNATFRIYENYLYNESSEKLNLYSRTIQSNLQKINDISFSVITDRYIQQELDTMNRYPETFEAMQAVQKMQERLIVHIKNQSFVTGIDIYDLHDNRVTVGNTNSVFNATMYGEAKQLIYEENGKRAWGDLTVQDDTSYSVRQFRKIANLELDSMGIVVIRVNLDKLVSLASVNANYHSQLLIVSDRQVIYPANSGYSREMLPELDGDEGYRIAKMNGESQLIAFSTFFDTNWTFLNIVPFSTINHSVTIMKYMMLSISVLIFLLACFLGERYARSITNPIEKLSRKISKARKGNFDLQTSELPQNLDEIARLDREFDRLMNQLDELINENYLKQIVLKETQYEALKSKVNPHFLYNTLESINWMAKLNGQNQIAQMVKSLGNLFRNSIENREIITIEEELTNVSDYIAIQKFRYEDRLACQLDIEESIQSYQIPGFILQPLVENCIKYGLERKKGVCKIKIAARLDDARLILSVQDNGEGMDPDFLNKLQRHEIQAEGTGVGLKNIDERIKHMFGPSYGVQIDSEEGKGTTVKIIMSATRIGEEQHVQSVAGG